MNRHHHEVEMEMIFVIQEIERLKKRKRIELKKEYKKAREYWPALSMCGRGRNVPMTHHFNPEVAARLGINQAIVLYNLDTFRHSGHYREGMSISLRADGGCGTPMNHWLSGILYLSVPQMKRVMKQWS